jgi:hypothetical protein
MWVIGLLSTINWVGDGSTGNFRVLVVISVRSTLPLEIRIEEGGRSSEEAQRSNDKSM